MTTSKLIKVFGGLSVAFAVSGCENVYSFFDTSPPAPVQTQAAVAPVATPAPVVTPAPVPAPVQTQAPVAPQPVETVTQPAVSPERQLILDDIFGGGDDSDGGGWSG